jgi:hypothetical protein
VVIADFFIVMGIEGFVEKGIESVLAGAVSSQASSVIVTGVVVTGLLVVGQWMLLTSSQDGNLVYH